MHGKGVYTWKDGRVYDGEYVEDKKNGYGVYRWADGRSNKLTNIFTLVYEGQWENGKQHGQGIYHQPDGSQKSGLWSEGKRI